ncbi:F-box/kelch-repeat protein SKIP25-like [Nicotiana tabacum]|uniref:F-box/kelch-repeat protein SKIP25-like n=2 Tax=Nicotiana TaxID=4085 RepID=A0A1S3ZNI5_TOBAC|nr:PREDICTED: F-box/kelch-repeat protein SKIP25-like [Nicotiana sylvestris]XP_016466100.1 PREDICTED: F-box/kelch-repeat protein SKIP25-like [Nicotiana tabacum]
MINSTNITTAGAAVKRRKTHHPHHVDDDHQSLIPGLPDHIAHICLNLVHPFTLFSTCHSWRKLIYSPSFPPYLSIYALLLPSHKSIDETSNSANYTNSIEFAYFDPISSKWHLLPPPSDPPLRLLVKHPSFISRNLPIQSVSVAGNLILLAATADHLLPAISRPLIFNPLTKQWSYGPPLATPRRWCAAGALNDVVYVASGVGSHYNSEVARSVVRWDLNGSNRSGPHCCTCKSDMYCNRKEGKNEWKWQEMSGLKDGKFSREAIDAIGWKGKLCMVNVKGDAAKEGIIYNVRTDTWQEMPEGMLMGWRGPAAAMAEETIYMVDESKGALRKYDEEKDIWVEIVENERLKGAEYIAAAGGRVCVVGGGGNGITVVDVVAEPSRVVVVESPVGFQVLNMHVIPRMSQLAEYSESIEQGEY